MASHFSTPSFPRNISLSSYLTSDDGESPSPDNVASVASAPARPTSPGDRSPSVQIAASRAFRRRVATVTSVEHMKRPRTIRSPENRTVQQYMRNSDGTNQESLYLQRLMSGSPSLLPQPRQVPGFSGVSVSDAVSPHVNDVFQDAVEEHIPDPAEDDKPVVTTEDVLSNMRDIMLEYYNENNKGHAYVYRDKKDKCQRFKIGSTDRPQARKSQLDKQCKYEGWELIQDPALPIREYRQLERLAHGELRNLRCDFICPGDGIKHREYFYGSNATASEVLGRWSRWLVDHEPYDKESKLKPFWSDRLECFTANKTAALYFNCKRSDCSRGGSSPVACQECLRIGWEVWTQPTTLDKVRYYCPHYARAIWERIPTLSTCLLVMVCGRLIGPMVFAHLHDSILRGQMIVTDLVICVCAVFCYFSPKKTLQSETGTKGLKRVSSNSGQVSSSPGMHSSRQGEENKPPKKRRRS